MVRYCKWCDKKLRAGKRYSKHKFCSRKCLYESMRTSKEKICGICGNVFFVQPHREKSGRGKFCSKKCYSKGMEKEKVEKRCKQCGIVFYVQPFYVRRNKCDFCSQECYRESIRNTVFVRCKYCGKEFGVAHYSIERGDGRFCSRHCFALFRRDRMIEVCKVCGSAFEKLTTSSRKYCSEECYYESKRTSVDVLCRICEEEFRVIPSQLKIGRGIYCSVECLGVSRSGENHHNWKGGKSFEPYTSDFNDEFKEKIRWRDRYSCQVCGITELDSNKKHSVHHIDYNKKNTIPENCITLCVSCHVKTNYNRESWIGHFSDSGSGQVLKDKQLAVI